MTRSIAHGLWTLLAVFALALVGTTAACKEKGAPIPELTADQVEQKLGQPGFYVFDNNPQDVFAENHVPGAKWVDYAHVNATDLPSDKNATLVFYCANEH
jgi:hypothetical protein